MKNILWFTFHILADVCGVYLFMGYLMEWLTFPKWFFALIYGIAVINGIVLTGTAFFNWWFGIKGNWRPISYAPKDGTFILATTENGHVGIFQFCSLGYWRSSVNSATVWTSLTHWQPVPKGLIG